MIDSNRQYLQTDLPGEVFNSNNGDIRNYNGRAVRVQVNNNGTRNLSDLGDYAQYHQGEDLKNAAAAAKAQNDTRFAQNKQEIGDFNTRFQTGTQNIINDTSNKYNLGGLLNVANSLGNRVSDLSGNTMGSGAGGYASSQQVDKALQTNYLPRYNQAVSNFQQGTTLAQNEEQQLFKPYETEATLLDQRMAREATAYTQQQTNELQGLIEKLKAGVALTQQEMVNANNLALKHIEYEQALRTAQITNQYQPVRSGDSLVNTFNGGVYTAR